MLKWFDKGVAVDVFVDPTADADADADVGKIKQGENCKISDACKSERITRLASTLMWLILCSKPPMLQNLFFPEGNLKLRRKKMQKYPKSMCTKRQWQK